VAGVFQGDETAGETLRILGIPVSARERAARIAADPGAV